MKKQLFICLSLLLLQGSLLHGQTAVPDTCITVDSLISESMKYLGIPYRWAGKTPKGFDCAGFTRYIYGKFGVTLAPSAGGQHKMCKKVDDDSLKVGDLVFYGGRKHTKAVGHVGIITEVNDDGTFRFIHSSTQSGICLTYSKEAYYKKRYIGACRIINCEATATEETKTEEP